LRAMFTYRPTTRVNGRCLFARVTYVPKALTSGLNVAMTRGRGIEKRRRYVGGARLGEKLGSSEMAAGSCDEEGGVQSNEQSESIKQASKSYID
jgi:hypothetical protein